MIIKNFSELALTERRRIVLELIEAGLRALNYEKALEKIDFDFLRYKNIYLIGFGKGSAEISKILSERINVIEGYVIDLIQPENLSSKIQFFQGTHPLPSHTNFEFTKKIIERFENKLMKEDLVIVIICGGGSAMLVQPKDLEKFIKVNQELLKSGANIYEMNIIRKHLDRVKGGGLAKILYPAKVLSLIVSDVPGNDLAIIASGPTVKDLSTKEEAWQIVQKFNLSINYEELQETSKDDLFFENVENRLILSNLTVLEAMKEKAAEFNLGAKILTDNLKGEVSEIVKLLLKEIENFEGNILLAGGETTVQVKGKGRGGRNQELVLWFLKYAYFENKINFNPLIISINSDGWDNTEFAGGIGDEIVIKKAQEMGLDIDEFLKNNDSFSFFEKLQQGIRTGRLPVNVADLILIMK